MRPRRPRCTLFPYTTLFRSHRGAGAGLEHGADRRAAVRDAQQLARAGDPELRAGERLHVVAGEPDVEHLELAGHRDRKSTRLNSSHVEISYAVFCLKKKKQRSTCFFIDAPATPEMYTLSLHDALPISPRRRCRA